MTLSFFCSSKTSLTLAIFILVRDLQVAASPPCTEYDGPIWGQSHEPLPTLTTTPISAPSSSFVAKHRHFLQPNPFSSLPASSLGVFWSLSLGSGCTSHNVIWAPGACGTCWASFLTKGFPPAPHLHMGSDSHSCLNKMTKHSWISLEIKAINAESLPHCQFLFSVVLGKS